MIYTKETALAKAREIRLGPWANSTSEDDHETIIMAAAILEAQVDALDYAAIMSSLGAVRREDCEYHAARLRAAAKELREA